MQSSYRVIKGIRVLNDGDAYIDTDYGKKAQIVSSVNKKDNNKANKVTEVNTVKYTEEFLKNAYEEANYIKIKAEGEAIKIKAEAYNKGYDEGKSKGYSEGKKQGYDDGYNEVINKAKEEADNLISNAENIMMQAKREYNNYLSEKEVEIRELIIDSVTKIIKNEISNGNGMNSIIEEALRTINDTQNVTIRCNSTYFNQIEDKAKEWEIAFSNKYEIFVIEDNALENGEAIINKDNGLIKVNIEYGIDKIREALIEQ